VDALSTCVRGAIVQGLGRGPLKAETWVRFPLALPNEFFRRNCPFTC
jgi:hypothetical protein